MRVSLCANPHVPHAQGAEINQAKLVITECKLVLDSYFTLGSYLLLYPHAGPGCLRSITSNIDIVSIR